jgi:hypothetical protein
MKRFILISFILAFILAACVSLDEIDGYYNVTVRYTVTNISNKTEFALIIYQDVLGDVEEEHYISANTSWSKDIHFRLGAYDREHLSVVAHSLSGTFETSITVIEIDRSVSSTSRLKNNGNEYYSLSQMHINADLIKRYR